MAETIRELLIKIGLDSHKALEGVQKLDGSFRSLRIGVMAVIGAISTVAGSAFFMAKSAAKAGVELYRTSKMIGLSIEKFQDLRDAANLAGVDVGSFTTGMIFFGKIVGGALQGGKEQMKALRTAGIKSLKDVNGHVKTQSELFLEVADAMRHAKSEQQRLNIVSSVFGRIGGAQMIPLLTLGSKQIQSMSRVARALAYDLTEKDIVASVNFTWTLKLLGMEIEGIKNRIGLALMPTLTKWGMVLLKLLSGQKKVNTELRKPLPLSQYIDFKDSLSAIAQTILFLNNEMITLKNQFKNILPDLHKFAKAFKDAFANLPFISQIFPEGEKLLRKSLDAYNKGVREYAAYMKGVNLRMAPTAAIPATAVGRAVRGAVTINHNPSISITVPPGTDTGQQQWFKNAASDLIDDVMQREIKNVFLANPIYEGSS